MCCSSILYITQENKNRVGKCSERNLLCGAEPSIQSVMMVCGSGPGRRCVALQLVCLSTIKTRDLVHSETQKKSSLWVPARLSRRGGRGGGPCPWENKHNVYIWGGNIVLVNRSVNKENMFPPHLTLLLSGTWDETLRRTCCSSPLRKGNQRAKIKKWSWNNMTELRHYKSSQSVLFFMFCQVFLGAFYAYNL